MLLIDCAHLHLAAVKHTARPDVLQHAPFLVLSLLQLLRPMNHVNTRQGICRMINEDAIALQEDEPKSPSGKVRRRKA
jgi:hypothetical protein